MNTHCTPCGEEVGRTADAHVTSRTALRFVDIHGGSINILHDEVGGVGGGRLDSSGQNQM